MQFNLVYKIPGDALLAKMPEATYDGPVARVTLRREAGGESFHLAISPLGETLPNVQAQPNHVAANVALQIQETEDHVAVLDRADIRLRSSPTELRCSVVIDDPVPLGVNIDSLIQTAGYIMITALNSIHGITLPPAELEGP